MHALQTLNQLPETTGFKVGHAAVSAKQLDNTLKGRRFGGGGEKVEGDPVLTVHMKPGEIDKRNGGLPGKLIEYGELQ